MPKKKSYWIYESTKASYYWRKKAKDEVIQIAGSFLFFNNHKKFQEYFEYTSYGKWNPMLNLKGYECQCNNLQQRNINISKPDKYEAVVKTYEKKGWNHNAYAALQLFATAQYLKETE